MTSVLRDVTRHLIDKYLGNYVEGLDKDSLKMSVFSGNIALSNLSIKPDAFSDLHPFFAVRRGVLGKLDIKVSWTKLKSKPVVVDISDVFLLLSPKSSIEFGENAASKATADLEQEKQEKLDLYEKSRSDAIDAADEGKAKSPGRIASLAATIVANIQVNFHNLHIRFEDPSPNFGDPYSLGFILRGLTVISAGEDWKAATLSSSLERLFKLVQVEGLSVYCDELAASHQMTAPDNLKNPAVFNRLKSQLLNSTHSWIFSPTHFSLKLAICKDAGKDDGWTKPKADIRLALDDTESPSLDVSLSSTPNETCLLIARRSLSLWEND
ncbi:hypothetical protein GEMRC1_007572 [Eukaryota sp. GEM-RC1]